VSDDLFREVDEEVRQEQYLRLWKQYGVYIAGAVLAIILITVGVVVWLDRQEGQRDADGEVLLDAIAASQERPDEALDLLADLAAEGSKGYRLLARLREGALLAERGDTRSAVAIYDTLAADSGQDQIYRDLAKVLAVSHGMSVMDRGEVEDRLAPVLGDDNPWRYSAHELVATAMMASGDTAAAREAYQVLVDDVNAPSGVRARSAEMLAILSQ